jgi:hypothetical protein
MKRTLEQLLLAHGIRGVVDALAEVVQKHADDGKTLPYDTANSPDDDPVDGSDLQNAAAVLRGDLW